MFRKTDYYDTPVDSFKKRYFYKLFFSLINFLFNLVVQIIIPRSLGPARYGDFNFLTNFFSQLSVFLDMGTSTCFYTKLSQRSKEQGLVSFYFIFSSVVLAFMIILTVVSMMAGIDSVLWPNQQALYVCLAIGLGFIIWFSQIINSITDAYGLTVPAEKLKIFQKLAAFCLLLMLLIMQYLNLLSYFLFNYAIWLIFIFLLIRLIVKSDYFAKEKMVITSERMREYAKEFWTFSHPFFAYSLIVLITGIFDRWILQVYGGSIQQGFYSLSFQIGAICLILTGAMTPLFMRELSIAHSNNDLSQMKKIFTCFAPLMYTITAFLSCFVAVQADKIVSVFGGHSFKGASIVVAIMAFYSIHQTYGQLSSSVFFATAQTKLYRNIGIIITVIGLPVTYFLIAPSNKMGMDAGAVGLAIKMVGLNIVGVNIQLWFNAKQLAFSFWRCLGHQIIIVGVFIVLALTGNYMATSLLKLNGEILIFVVSGVIYSIMAVAIVYLFPIMMGIRRADIHIFMSEFGKKVLRN